MRKFKSLRTDDFKLGDVVTFSNGILGKVVMIYKRFLDVQDGDGRIYSLIPAHGELRHWEP